MARLRNTQVTKKSYFKIAEHRNDDIKNTGYNYEGSQFKNSLSSYLYEDPVKERILVFFEQMIFFLTEYTKMIKKSANYAIEKNFTKFN